MCAWNNFLGSCRQTALETVVLQLFFLHFSRILFVQVFLSKFGGTCFLEQTRRETIYLQVTTERRSYSQGIRTTSRRPAALFKNSREERIRKKELLFQGPCAEEYGIRARYSSQFFLFFFSNLFESRRFDSIRFRLIPSDRC